MPVDDEVNFISICGLISNAVSSSGYMDYRIMDWKGYGRKRS
jgi:hypothetical protein